MRRRSESSDSSGSGSDSSSSSDTSSSDGEKPARISGRSRADFASAFRRAVRGSAAVPDAFWEFRGVLWRVGRRLYALAAGAPQVFGLDAPTSTAYGVRRWPAAAGDPVVACLRARRLDAAARAAARRSAAGRKPRKKKAGRRARGGRGKAEPSGSSDPGDGRRAGPRGRSAKAAPCRCPRDRVRVEVEFVAHERGCRHR